MTLWDWIHKLVTELSYEYQPLTKYSAQQYMEAFDAGDQNENGLLDNPQEMKACLDALVFALTADQEHPDRVLASRQDIVVYGTQEELDDNSARNVRVYNQATAYAAELGVEAPPMGPRVPNQPVTDGNRK
jgi:hypothetical protein